jgi:hypothetical protein
MTILKSELTKRAEEDVAVNEVKKIALFLHYWLESVDT